MGCDKSRDKAVSDTAAKHDERTEVVVLAASSLTDAFQALAKDFEKQHPEAKISLQFAGSQALRAQIERGNEADVFASANEAHMKALVDAKLAAQPQIFAHNELVIAVPKANPAKLHSVGDLPQAKRLVVGAKQVPVGHYTRTFLDRAAGHFGMPFAQVVIHNIASKETNARQVLAKVAAGEADAGIVYRSDARAAKDRVDTVEIPDDLNVRAAYSIAALDHAAHPKLARQWVDLVTSASGQAVLAKQGFVTEASAGSDRTASPRADRPTSPSSGPHSPTP